MCDRNGRIYHAHVCCFRPMFLQQTWKKVQRLSAPPPSIPSHVAPAPRPNNSIPPCLEHIFFQISFPKFKVALALAGVLLTSEELQVLQNGFRSDRSKDMVSLEEVVCINVLSVAPTPRYRGAERVVACSRPKIGRVNGRK